MSLAAVPLALAIDAATGDPDWLWRRTGHPVTWMGAAIDRLEERLNRRRRIDGVVALGALVGVFGAGALAVDALLPDNVVGLVIEALLASTLLAHRSLHQHVKAVADAPDLPAARRAVAMVVGRETATMDEAAVSRAALETLGENWSDGVVAPAFWLAVAGLPGLVAYKAINTANSMIGHRTPRFEAFGWAAARVDDVANLIPARLAAVVIALARPRTFRAWPTVVAGAHAHVSPNAGWPEAALAVALGVELGGPRRYGDREVDGIRLNPGRRQPDRRDIRRGLALSLGAGLIHAALYVALAVAV